MAIKRYGGGGDTVDEITVVADQQHGAIIIAKDVLQQVQRFNIQIVGRFIHDQQVRWFRHQLGQQQAGLFAAR